MFVSNKKNRYFSFVGVIWAERFAYTYIYGLGYHS